MEESRNNGSCVSVCLGEGVLRVQAFHLSWVGMHVESDSSSELLSTIDRKEMCRHQRVFEIVSNFKLVIEDQTDIQHCKPI